MTALYAPGTDETDPKKQNRALQLYAGEIASAKTDTATNTTDIATANTNIATNTSGIATNTAAIATNTAAIATNTTNIAGNTSAISALQTLASPIHASLSGDVALNNIANYFTGPSVAQGTSGTWFVSGIVTFVDPSTAQTFYAKLWDGTTVIASGAVTTGGANFLASVSLSGYLASPAGDIKISCRAPNGTTGKIIFNSTGNSKDSTISAYRIA